MAPRSRTGCLTCRQRKLKCSEERPICAQCLKANRECIPSSGITFRHQQNPSMNGALPENGGLKRFYGYKETFAKGTVWVDVPQELTFVHTSNPYDDEDGSLSIYHSANSLENHLLPFGSSEHVTIDATLASGLASLAQAGYEAAYATHGLEALSAVASQDYQYVRPPQIQPHDSSIADPGLVDPQNMDLSHQDIMDQHNLELLLESNAADDSGNNIDPRLHDELTAVMKSGGLTLAQEDSEQARTYSLFPSSPLRNDELKDVLDKT